MQMRTILRPTVLLDGFLLLFLLLLLLPASSYAQPAPWPVLVKVTDGKGQNILGELQKEEGDRLELLDLKTGTRVTFEKSTLNDLRRGITEREAAETMGLAELLAWKVRRVI